MERAVCMTLSKRDFYQKNQILWSLNMDRGEGGLGWGKYYFKHMWLIQFQAAWCDFFVLTDQIIFQTNQSSYR